jgi:nitrogen fixation-related uncharacterized protein
MSEATIALTAMTALLLISFLGFLIWGIVSGQFKNIEEAKYQIFRNTKSGNSNDTEGDESATVRGGDHK